MLESLVATEAKCGISVALCDRVAEEKKLVMDKGRDFGKVVLVQSGIFILLK